jgi:hypothetical protein
MVVGAPCGLFTVRPIYQFSARSMNVIASCSTLVSSSMIYLSVQIFSQINRFFFVSSYPSPWNSGNRIVGFSPAIVKFVVLPPMCSVYK